MRLVLVAAVALALLVQLCLAATEPKRAVRPSRGSLAERRFQNSRLGAHFSMLGYPSHRNCTTLWITQYIDHYSFGHPSGAPTGVSTYQQKYLVYDKYYRAGGPIFFYAGNEAPIEVFVDIAGLMWENAAEFGAALVFGEHRFFGASMPCNGADACRPHFSTMQAMADYAVLLANLTAQGGRYADSKGIITFGGSYGGMLSAWMRIKYPNLITGSIASSAPIFMVSPDYRRSSYWQVITRDATAFGGAEPNCSWTVYRAIQATFEYLKTTDGRNTLSEIFATCTPILSESEGQSQLGYFIQAAFDILGMGDYPFETDFMFGAPGVPAPAWPMRVACSLMDSTTSDNHTLVQSLMNAISVMYNVTQDVTCYDITQNPTSDGAWDYLVCSEGMINELPYFAAVGWPNDMFYPQPVWTHERYDEHCTKKFGLTTRWGWLNTTFGAGNVQGATNIVFANGLLDPWHSGGILTNVSATVRSYIIPEGAHHLDLFFTGPFDPPGVKFVRRQEMNHIREWLSQL